VGPSVAKVIFELPPEEIDEFLASISRFDLVINTQILDRRPSLTSEQPRRKVPMVRVKPSPIPGQYAHQAWCIEEHPEFDLVLAVAFVGGERLDGAPV
jgi:hypothetical protein